MYIPFTPPIVFLCHLTLWAIEDLLMFKSVSKIYPEADEVSLLRELTPGDRSPVAPYEVVYYSGHAGEIDNDDSHTEMTHPPHTRVLPSMWQCIKNAFSMPNV